jgi:hypothetical protein
MAKPADDLGYALRLNRPLKLQRFDPRRLPDPAECVDCLIIVNDRSDGVPRARLALSNGASWDFVAIVGEGTAVAPMTDLQPLVRQAVAAELPSLLPQQEVRMLSPPPGQDLQPLANAVLEMAEQVNRLMAENIELRDRVDQLDRHAIVGAELRRA